MGVLEPSRVIGVSEYKQMWIWGFIFIFIFYLLFRLFFFAVLWPSGITSGGWGLYRKIESRVVMLVPR